MIRENYLIIIAIYLFVSFALAALCGFLYTDEVRMSPDSEEWRLGALALCLGWPVVVPWCFFVISCIFMCEIPVKLGSWIREKLYSES